MRFQLLDQFLQRYSSRPDHIVELKGDSECGGFLPLETLNSFLHDDGKEAATQGLQLFHHLVHFEETFD